jgi:hypothetical protein
MAYRYKFDGHFDMEKDHVISLLEGNKRPIVRIADVSAVNCFFESIPYIRFFDFGMIEENLDRLAGESYDEYCCVIF